MGSEQVTPLALAVWAKQFATLLGAGVSLARELEILSQITDPPLGPLTADLRERVLAGSTLSQAMGEHPDVFGPLAVAIVRAGEVGGVLDEAMSAWADWLARDMEFHARLHTSVLLARALGLAGGEEQAWAFIGTAMPDLRERSREFAYCAMASMMLASGVPLIQALQVAAEVWADDPDRAGTLATAVAEPGDCVHAALGQVGLSPLTCQLIAVGEETGQLDRMFSTAAEVLQHELETRMSVALSGLHGGMEERAR